MLQDRDKEYPDYFPKHWLDLYKFTENEKTFKKIYESEYGYLLMTPMYMDQLLKMIDAYDFLPEFTQPPKIPKKSAAGQFTLQHLGIWKNSEIFMCRHERYCYPLIHTHSYVEALYVYDGACRHLICGQTIELHKGDFCILSPNAPHCVLAYADDNIILNFLIHEDIFNAAFLMF